MGYRGRGGSYARRQERIACNRETREKRAERARAATPSRSQLIVQSAVNVHKTVVQQVHATRRNAPRRDAAFDRPTSSQGQLAVPFLLRKPTRKQRLNRSTARRNIRECAVLTRGSIYTRQR